MTNSAVNYITRVHTLLTLIFTLIFYFNSTEARIVVHALNINYMLIQTNWNIYE